MNASFPDIPMGSFSSNSSSSSNSRSSIDEHSQ
jgi:hypothetical protein